VKGIIMLRNLVFALLLASVARADYTVVELNGTFGFASSVFNDAGQFAGTRDFGSGPRAFRWSLGSGFTNLGGDGSSGTAISSNGLVAGLSQFEPGNPTQRAFLWQPGVGMTDLGTLGGASSQATGVNSIGNVVGRSPLAEGTQRAFLWQPGVGMTDLGVLPGAASTASSIANAITDNNRVVGSAQDLNGNTRPFLWTSADGLLDLGTLGGSVGVARDANDAGLVVGQALRADDTNGAFVWTSLTGMIDLGTFGGGTSGALSVNASGQVVGFAQDVDGVNRAFLWDSVNGLRDLNGLVANQNLTSALAINDAGAIIAQTTSNDGFTLLLLTPDAPEPVPAPPAAMLAGLAIAIGTVRRLRRGI